MQSINTGDPRPIFKQIVDHVRRRIATGELRAGDKLPSVRALAMDLTINTNTVAKAYTELTNLGLAEARKGLGLFVAEQRQVLSSAEEQRRLHNAIKVFVDEIVDLSVSSREIQEQVGEALKSIGRQADDE